MELKPLTRKLSLTSAEVKGVPVQTGKVDDHDVVAIVTGMGTKLAREGVERLLDAMTVERVVVVGITGALENTTPIGTLVSPATVVDSATGAEHRPESLDGRPQYGVMWTGDVLLTEADALADLRAKGVVSLDMETAAIADVCERRGVPWSVFRAISDRASDGSVDEEIFRLSNQDGTPNPTAVAKYFAKHPGRIPTMAKLAKGAKRATEVAADAAIAAIRGLP
jgi:adenosylhomocysteine nucleosidase